MRVGNGVVFTVAGSKGGVGKTTTSINLSAALADAGEDVVLVEFDIAMANVGDFLDIDVGLEGEDPTLHEVLAGKATVVDATYESPGGFDVIPSGASLHGYRDADIGKLSEVLPTLQFAYDVVIIDTGAGVSEGTVLPLALADETILVSSPRVASVRDTMKTRDLTRQVGGSVAGVVFVKSGTGRSPGVDHIADFLSVDLLGHVPEDSAVPDAQDRGVPVIVAAPESDAAGAYHDLGARLSEHVDALGGSGTLSTDSLNQDESGFAFIDAPVETSETNDTADTDERAGREEEAREPSGGTAPHRTNGHASETAAMTVAIESDTEPTAESESSDSTHEVDSMDWPAEGDELEDAEDTASTEDTEDADGADDRDETNCAGDTDDMEDAGSAGDTDRTDETDDTFEGDDSSSTDDVADTAPFAEANRSDGTAVTDTAEAVDDETAEVVGRDETPSDESPGPSAPAGPADNVDSSDSLSAADGDRPESTAAEKQTGADASASAQSTTGRLINRAKNLVNRRGD